MKRRIELTEREKWEEKEGTKVGIVFQKITQVRATSQFAFKSSINRNLSPLLVLEHRSTVIYFKNAFLVYLELFLSLYFFFCSATNLIS